MYSKPLVGFIEGLIKGIENQIKNSKKWVDQGLLIEEAKIHKLSAQVNEKDKEIACLKT